MVIKILSFLSSATLGDILFLYSDNLSEGHFMVRSSYGINSLLIEMIQTYLSSLQRLVGLSIFMLPLKIIQRNLRGLNISTSPEGELECIKLSIYQRHLLALTTSEYIHRQALRTANLSFQSLQQLITSSYLLDPHSLEYCQGEDLSSFVTSQQRTMLYSIFSLLIISKIFSSKFSFQPIHLRRIKKIMTSRRLLSMGSHFVFQPPSESHAKLSTLR
mmetsp:Transcript_10363/g.15469  ORF Transcript_10363/g.15469 Transcript_10363/m.15469 type:complete len:217 (+) Transcript_10363:5947-6597(+)